METAPILLFTYNRPWHTRHTIEALQKNFGASKSTLIIISDGPKTFADEKKVSDVRNYIKGVGGFQNICVIERDSNQGLADNIITGVSEVVNQYGKVIVLEDDIATSPYFINYMNDALRFYEDVKEVMHISGWIYPIDAEGLPETFLWRVMNCWGWATWADRWRHYNRDMERTINSFSKNDIYRFNLDGSHNFWKQIISNRNKEIYTWAIFWYATIFKNNGLCLNPTRSLTQNIGLDGTGMHCRSDAYLGQNTFERQVNYFPSEITENKAAVALVKTHLGSCKKITWQKILNRAKKSYNNFKRGRNRAYD